MVKFVIQDKNAEFCKKFGILFIQFVSRCKAVQKTNDSNYSNLI